MIRVRVAHIITRLCKGGAQENTFHTVRLANRNRFTVDLISGETFGQEGSIEDEVRAAGINVIRVPHLVRQVAPLHDLRALRHLTRLLREGGYGIVHTHTSKAGFLGRWAAKRSGVPIIVHTPHGNIFEGYFSGSLTRLFVAMERRAAQWTDRIIELTPRGVEEHLAQGIGRREQFSTIFSGIDLAPFTAAVARREATRRALGIEQHEFLVGAVARLEPVKGLTYLVSAAHAVLDALPNARFIIAGQGSLDGDLRTQAASLGDRFRLLGPRDDVPDLMAAMDVFVLPSVNEGMGRVLLEAGAAGTPSVASRVGGVPDIIEDGRTGILVPPRDPEALARAIRTLAEDERLRQAMGQAAQTSIVPEYGLDRMVARIEALYEELIEEKRHDR